MDLDRKYCQSVDNTFPCNCRVFTKSASGGIGDIDVIFDIEILEVGTYTIWIDMDSPNITNAVTGLSIHAIQASWNGDICGCTQQNALNYNPHAVIDDGSCKFPSPPPPPAPVYAKPFSFIGRRSHWKDQCGCWIGWKWSCELVKYRIVWGDGNVEEGTSENGYVDQVFPHTYVTIGEYFPYVTVTRCADGCINSAGCWKKVDETTWLGQVSVRPNINPIINLLLLD